MLIKGNNRVILQKELPMPASIPSATLEKFSSFGDLLRFLRRRAGMTQMELSIAVGYSDAQISRLEQGLRLPDIPTVEARFMSALCLEDEPGAVARLLELAATVRREDAPALGLCPYKGLNSFEEADADLFVGREALTSKITERIIALATGDQSKSGRFFVIVGASGSGKSSLVRAGLVPALRWDKRSANWQIHVLTPSAHPLESLATSFTQDIRSVAATATLIDDLTRDRRSLSLYIKRELNTSGAPLVLLVVDQFEELFALCHSEAERSSFIDNLLTASSGRDGPAVVVITLRADFYAHCASYLQLREALPRQQEYIGAMSSVELRRAIEEPAFRGHWEFESGLVDLILHDVGHEPGALPLLSHALLETWQRRHGHRMTLSGYISSGGVRRAIAETAEAVFTDQFTREQQLIARRIFLRLTELGDETASGDTGRRVKFKELILKPEESIATNAVLKALADARLITTSEDSVQVAHEALIREWPKLRGWLEDNREDLRLHRLLADSAQQWLAVGREPGMLYRGARLQQALEWAAFHVEDMNVLEREFLAASTAFVEGEANEREAQRQREVDAARKLVQVEKEYAEEQRKNAQRLRRRALFLAGTMVSALILAFIALYAWRQTVSEAALSHSLLLASTAQQLNQAGRGDLAMALALKAVDIRQPPPYVERALRAIATSPGTIALLDGHQRDVRAAALSPDGLLALSGSCAKVDDQDRCLAGELILWDTKAKKEIRLWSGHPDWVNFVVFIPESRTALSGSMDGSLILWDLSTGSLIREFTGHARKVTSLSVASDGSVFLSGSEDGTMILWDLASADPIRRFDSQNGPVTSVALEAGGHTALSGSEEGILSIWDVDNGLILKQIAAHALRVNAVAMSTDGSWILSTSNDLLLRLWDRHTGEILKEQTINCRPDKLSLSGDGTLALFSCEGLTYLWDVQNWREQQRLLGHTAYINALDISSDGKVGLSAASDNTVRLWSLQGQFDYQTTDTGVPDAAAVAITPDGKHLLLGSEPPSLWDEGTKRTVKTYPGFDGWIPPGALAVSPEGRYIAAAGGIWPPTDVRSLLIWDFESGEVKCRLEGHRTMLRSVAFSSDSQMLLAGSQNPPERSGDLILWNTENCQIIRRFETMGDVTSIAFSADNSLAITGQGYSPQVTLWDVSTGREIRRYATDQSSGLEAPILNVAFGPGDSTIVGSGVENLYQWDIQSGEILQVYRGHTGIPWSLSVSPDGSYLVSSSETGEIILWEFSTGEELYRLETHVQGINSVTFSPDGKRVYSFSSSGLLTQWQIPGLSQDALLNWIPANRYVPQLTCEERSYYQVKPLCKQSSND
jgi:WD40 repeat protein/transcriptional regulator with XRE-family HTH domain